MALVRVKLEITDPQFFEDAHNRKESIRVWQIRQVLPHFIESWDSTNGNAVVWVRVPKIPAGGSVDIYLYYGNPDANPRSSAEEVFIRVIDGLEAAWCFDEDSGNTAYDSSGNDRHATIYGATRTDGKYGKALSFDGANDYVALPFCYGKNSIAETTVCAWVKSSSKDYQIIISFDRSEVWRLALKDDGGTGNVGWDTTDSSNMTHDLGTPNDYTDGNWHFICGWYKAGASPDKKIFVDGEVVAEATAHGGKKLGAGSERTCTYGFIGVGSEAGTFNGAKGPLNWFNGLIDEVMIFNRALTEGEISDLYNYYGYTTPNYPGKVLVRKYADPEPTVTIGEEEPTGLTSWPYRRKITITNNGNTDLEDFQVKIQLDSTNFDFTKAQSTGADIRFVLLDMEPHAVNYYIETWDTQTPRAVIWVALDENDPDFYIEVNPSYIIDGSTPDVMNLPESTVHTVLKTFRREDPW